MKAKSDTKYFLTYFSDTEELDSTITDSKIPYVSQSHKKIAFIQIKETECAE